MLRTYKSTATKEEKIAIKLSTLMTDFTVDIEKVGYYLYHATPYLLFRRSIEVLDSARLAEDLREQREIGYDIDRIY